jgi:hypothetical protein
MNEFVKIPGCTCGASEHYKAGAGHNQNCALYADAPPHPTWLSDAPLSSNLVVRIRNALQYGDGLLLGEAADEIERLRSWLHIDDSQMWFACVKCGMAKRLPKDSISFICDGCQEIERLRTALQGTKDDLYSVDKAAQELGAERDRLRAALVDVVIAETLERAKRVAREGLTPTYDFHQSDAMRIQIEKEMGK